MGEEALDLLRVMSASDSVESAPGTSKTVRYPLSIEQGTTEKDLRCFKWKPMPGSGLDCLISASFALQRTGSGV
jgi:hypothetical protein